MLVRVRTYTREVESALAAAKYIAGPVGVSAMLKGPIIEYLQGQVRRRFASQSDRSTGPWAELSPATQQYRFMQGFNPTWPINVRFGDFRSFLENDRGSLSTHGFDVELTFPGPADSSIEAKLIGAQTGQSKEARDFPPRPVVSLDVQDAAAILGIMEAQIMIALKTKASGFTAFSVSEGGIPLGSSSPKGFGGGIF